VLNSKRPRFLLAALPLMFLTREALAQTAAWQEYMREGEDAYQHRKYQDAVKLFRSTLREAEEPEAPASGESL
jgi:hypothetical protein